MNATILSIGDELALGQTIDTNSAWMSQQLAAVGVDVAAHMTVGDDQAAIERAVRFLIPLGQTLVISGGLGPTDDDLTRQALSSLMSAPLELDERWQNELRSFFEKRGRAMPATNTIQAMIPKGASLIWNTCGTAAGIRAKVHGCDVFAVPGVPKEMKAMFNNDILPFVRESGGGGVILQRTLHTFGLGESVVAEKLGDLMKRGRNPSVGTTVAGGVVSLRVNARFPSLVEATRQMETTVRACSDALGDLIYGVDGQSLAEAVAALLKNHPDRPTVATAESCTGGLLAKMLTDVAGSSDYFRYGWVTYANEAKQSELAVPESVLTQHGAVSEQTVIAMAESARKKSGATYALSISGVAGPAGGTESKPVGTVCLCLAHAGGNVARTFNFSGDREMIRDRSAKMALAMLRYQLLGKAMPF